MTGRFWFGLKAPREFRDPAVRDLLSFNGQLHFRCRSCHEVIWADITFGKAMMKSDGPDFPCPNCRQQPLDVIRFVAIESRSCSTCGAQAFGSPGDTFSCSLCGGNGSVSNATWIHPPYPTK